MPLPCYHVQPGGLLAIEAVKVASDKGGPHDDDHDHSDDQSVHASHAGSPRLTSEVELYACRQSVTVWIFMLDAAGNIRVQPGQHQAKTTTDVISGPQCGNTGG